MSERQALPSSAQHRVVVRVDETPAPTLTVGAWLWLLFLLLLFWVLFLSLVVFFENSQESHAVPTFSLCWSSWYRQSSRVAFACYAAEQPTRS